MSTIKTTTLSTQGGSTVPVDTVVNGTAKAWVNFNGTGTVAIRRAFNVSSITDNAVGQYTVNLTTAMVDADYAALALTGYISAGDVGHISPSCRNLVAESFKIINYNDGDALVDADYVNAAIFS